MDAILGCKKRTDQPRDYRLIAYFPPYEGIVKHNTDGSSKGNPRVARAGGILCNGSGR